MGLPVNFTALHEVGPDLEDSMFILLGDTPKFLSRKQIQHIFRQGVLLDALAAQTIQDMNLADLLGIYVGKPIENIQSEIISDQSFAAAHYGNRTLLTPFFRDRDFRLLTANHPDARPITTLAQKDNIPNLPGIIIFDDKKRNSRAAILPYTFNLADPAPFLTLARQRHFYDLFCWLKRSCLPCFVENSPDLAVFYIHHPDRHRIILALLNLSFDWALDARIRLGSLPFKVNKIRLLNEQGRFDADSKLQLTTLQGYQYIQLTPDSAVPPMQMSVLILER